VTWQLPDDTTVAAPTAPAEPVVGGVYLRLFVANPGWVVRRPKEFLSELMDTCLGLMNREKLDVSRSTFLRPFSML
jgi:DnaJ family protein C protein 13